MLKLTSECARRTEDAAALAAFAFLAVVLLIRTLRSGDEVGLFLGSSGVGGAIELGWALDDAERPKVPGMTSAGGPTKARRTGRKTRPLKAPRMINAVSTRKKYLEKRELEIILF